MDNWQALVLKKQLVLVSFNSAKNKRKSENNGDRNKTI